MDAHRLPFSRPAPSGLGAAAVALAAAAAGVCLPAQPAAAQAPTGPELTIPVEGTALVRTTVDRRLDAGRSTIRVTGLPRDVDPSSLFLPDPSLELVGVHGRHSYVTPQGNEGLSLALDVRAERAVDGLRLAYRTRSLSWRPDYTVVAAPDGESARMEIRAVVSNDAGTPYRDASVELLARTAAGGFRPAGRPEEEGAGRSPAGGAAAPEDDFGYHRFPVEDALSLERRATRRVRLLAVPRVALERAYVTQGTVEYNRSYAPEEPMRVGVRYRISRPDESRVAELPLPGGTLRLVQTGAGGALGPLASGTIEDTPPGEDLLLEAGRALDLRATRQQIVWKGAGDGRYETGFRIELENRSDAPVTVRVIETVLGEWDLLESSREAERLPEGRLRFAVPVPARGEASVEFTVRAGSPIGR